MSKFTIHIFLITILSLLSPEHAFAQKLSPGPQVLSFFSSADDAEQPYGIYIPKNYDASRKYPLVMMLHGAGSNHRLALRRVFGKSNADGENDVEATKYFPAWDDVDFIVVSPFARGTAGYQGIPEEDVYDVLDDVRGRLSIDANRIYLTGLSMGGGGALWIGLTRPDIWAAVAPVCPAPPQGTMDLALNAFNFPLHFFHGDADPVVPVEGTRKWVSNLQDIGAEVFYKEFAGVKHDSWVNAYDNEFIFEWFGPAVRNPYPDQVRFVSKLYKYNKAFWVIFDKIKYGSLAEIDARFKKENTITISTKNLEGYTLNLNGHPRFKLGSPISFEVDGQVLTAPGDSLVTFIRNNNFWAIGREPISSLPSKIKGSEGPIFDAFSTRHIYIYGTADNPSEEELKKRIDVAKQAADWSVYRSPDLGRVMFFPRVLADKDLRKSDFESSNLILFGTKENNEVIAMHADQLPLHLSPSAKNYGLLYVFPMNKHYIAVCSGLPWWTGAKEMGLPFVPLNYRKLTDYKDLLFFKESSQNVIVDAYFTSSWKLTEESANSLSSSGVVSIKK